MNEKMNDFLYSTRDAVGQVSDTAADVAYGVGKKAGELLSVAKMNIQLVDLKACVNTALRELGELLYATHTGDPTDSKVLQAKLEEIDHLKAQIVALEKQLGREQAARTCDTCGAPSREGDAFCRTCGDKLA